MRVLWISRWFWSLIVPLFLVLASVVETHAAVWRPGVIEGGNVRALARDPASGRIYAGGGHGLVFASDDGGASWQRVNETPLTVNGIFDLTTASGALLTIQQIPRQLLRSTDGGATWTDVTGALGGASAVFVERHVAVPSRLYLGTGAHGLLVSQDSGLTWTSLSNGLADGGGVLPSLNGFSQSPARPQTMYTISQARGLFRSTNGGASWSALDGEPNVPRQVLAHPGDGDTVYMINFDGVYRSSDRGDSWQEIAEGSFNRMGFSPGGALIVGLVAEMGMLRSTDEGTTFTPVPLDLNPESVSDLLALEGSSRLLAATLTGVLASSDDGVTWSLANDGLGAVLANDLVVASGDGTRVFLAHEGGVQRSDDRGATWSRIEPGEVGEFLGPIAASAQSPLNVFAALTTMASSTRVPVSTDAGESWSASPPLEEGFGPTALAVDRLSDQRLGLGLFGDPSFAADFEAPEFAGGFYLSEDGGSSWQQIYVPEGDLGSFQPTSMIVRGDLIVAGYIAAGESFSGFFGAVVRSDDGGGTWTEVFKEDGFVFPFLALDPVDPALLYLSGGVEHRLQRSLDGGESWAPLAGLPEATVFDMATDSVRGDIVLVVQAGGVGIHRSTDRGNTWELLPSAPDGEHFRQVASSADGTIHATTNAGVYSLVPDEEACAGEHRLCLTGGRFLVEVAWQDFQGGSGSGVAQTLTSDTGYFWFFDPANVELVVKVLDARAVNGHFWVFYGSLTNVEFRLRVTDRETGEVVDYFNPSGQFASRGDTAAFPVAAGGASAAPSLAGAISGLRRVTASDGTCTATATDLCLADGRFRVDVAWEDFQGGSGAGQAVPISADTGSFWFFDPANVELVVKVLDARAVNGHFWVFYGALSNVGYTLTVTDTETGDEVTYENPSGTFGSRGDTAAFPD